MDKIMIQGEFVDDVEEYEELLALESVPLDVFQIMLELARRYFDGRQNARDALIAGVLFSLGCLHGETLASFL